MNPLLLGPALVLRALEDLHTIAEAARGLPDNIAGVEERLARIEDQVERALGVTRDIEDTATTLAGLGEQVDTRLGDVMELGERVEARAGEIIVLGGTLQQLADVVLEEARVMAVRAQAVAEVGAQVVESLPTLERAVTMATSLEGAVERVGRLVDRLPGGRPPERGERPPER